jgi:hypothetical protein
MPLKLAAGVAMCLCTSCRVGYASYAAEDGSVEGENPRTLDELESVDW